jgi:hypothetical protein
MPISLQSVAAALKCIAWPALGKAHSGRQPADFG